MRKKIVLLNLLCCCLGNLMAQTDNKDYAANNTAQNYRSVPNKKPGDQMRNPVDLCFTMNGKQYGGSISFPLANKSIGTYKEGRVALNALNIGWCGEAMGSDFTYDPLLMEKNLNPVITDAPVVEYLSGQLYHVNTGIKLTTRHFSILNLYGKLGLGYTYQKYQKNVYLLEFLSAPSTGPVFEYRKYYYDQGITKGLAPVIEVGSIIKITKYIGLIGGYRMLKTPKNHPEKMFSTLKMGVCFGYR